MILTSFVFVLERCKARENEFGATRNSPKTEPKKNRRKQERKKERLSKGSVALKGGRRRGHFLRRSFPTDHSLGTYLSTYSVP